MWRFVIAAKYGRYLYCGGFHPHRPMSLTLALGYIRDYRAIWDFVAPRSCTIKVPLTFQPSRPPPFFPFSSLRYFTRCNVALNRRYGVFYAERRKMKQLRRARGRAILIVSSVHGWQWPILYPSSCITTTAIGDRNISTACKSWLTCTDVTKG